MPEECDIAISTAAIPGRPSPLLITKAGLFGVGFELREEGRVADGAGSRASVAHCSDLCCGDGGGERRHHQQKRWLLWTWCC